VNPKLAVMYQRSQRELYQENQELNARIGKLEAENAELTRWIIEADSAYNLDGHVSVFPDECLGLVRMCHEGRAALDELAAKGG